MTAEKKKLYLYYSSIIRNFAADNTSIMRQLFILILSALFLTGCNKTSTLLSLEDRASAGIWFCELREEVLTLDKENSAFICQHVSVVKGENGQSSAYRNGRAIPFPYVIQDGKFVFDTNHMFINAFNGIGTAYEEAWFDEVGNLIIQIGTYNPTGNGYQKDPRPERTGKAIYVLKDPSFMAN